MSGISTHVLNTSSGRPASNVDVRLFSGTHEIAAGCTDADGRCPNLLPAGASLQAAVYRLVFAVQSVFPEGFYPEVAITFQVRDPSMHHHVPLLISAFGYTTYRGS